METVNNPTPIKGCYMSVDEERRRKGEILLELAETEKQLKQWHDSAKEIGGKLNEIGRQFSALPERLQFAGEPEAPQEFYNPNLCSRAALDAERICTIRDSIRQLNQRKAELQQSKEDFGLKG
jgi:hypothetical protein